MFNRNALRAYLLICVLALAIGAGGTTYIDWQKIRVDRCLAAIPPNTLQLPPGDPPTDPSAAEVYWDASIAYWNAVSKHAEAEEECYLSAD